MKGIDIFCASQAATAICQPPPSSSPFSSSAAVLLGASGREIDRHNPIIRDARRIPKQILAPCTTSQAPISPKSLKNIHKKRNEMKILPKEINGGGDDGEIKMKRSLSSQKIRENGVRRATAVMGRKSWSCTRPSEFISPPGSTRYLLSEKVIFNTLSDLDPSGKKINTAETCEKENEVCREKTPACPNQVVVLRVSLHCRGCEKKMRKHISRMEGVTSFDIDFAAKKVTLSGNITPLEVLSSISKVKNAQLWSPTITTSANQPPLDLTKPEISKNTGHEGGVAA